MTPQRPGTLSDENIELMKRALEHAAGSQELVELAVTQALNDGGSVRQVSDATGLSTSTIQKYGHAHGWPSTDRRKQLSAHRDEADAFRARLRAAEAWTAEFGEHLK
jgi:hypothetical protein